MSGATSPGECRRTRSSCRPVRDPARPRPPNPRPAPDEHLQLLGRLDAVKTSAPDTAHTSATPSGQGRRHHSERQASDPQATSTTSCGVDNRPVLSRSVGIRKSAPSAAASRHPAASSALSRPDRGPSAFGRAGSTGASSHAGTSRSAGRTGSTTRILVACPRVQAVRRTRRRLLARCRQALWLQGRRSGFRTSWRDQCVGATSRGQGGLRSRRQSADLR